MQSSRWGIFLWSGLIIVLLIIEIAEVTHLFTLPLSSAIGDPLAFVSALVFTTILALVGAIFIGVYISARLLSEGGFSPFEEEMLKMRNDLRELKEAVQRQQAAASETASDPPATPPKERP